MDNLRAQFPKLRKPIRQLNQSIIDKFGGLNKFIPNLGTDIRGLSGSLNTFKFEPNIGLNITAGPLDMKLSGQDIIGSIRFNLENTTSRTDTTSKTNSRGFDIGLALNNLKGKGLGWY